MSELVAMAFSESLTPTSNAERFCRTSTYQCLRVPFLGARLRRAVLDLDFTVGLGTEMTCRARFINRSCGVSPGTDGNLIFVFGIVLCLGVAWRHVVGIASWAVNSLYVSRRPNAEPAASTKRLASLPLRSLYRKACSSR